jgi:hypothetical protein
VSASSVDSKTKGIMLLASKAGVDLNTTATETILYTVPSGRTCIISRVILRNFSADSASSTVSIGQAGTATDFLGTQTLTGITGSYLTQALTLTNVPNATPVVQVVYAASLNIVLKTVAAAGSACTCTADVFGYLI